MATYLRSRAIDMKMTDEEYAIFHERRMAGARLMSKAKLLVVYDNAVRLVDILVDELADERGKTNSSEIPKSCDAR